MCDSTFLTVTLGTPLSQRIEPIWQGGEIGITFRGSPPFRPEMMSNIDCDELDVAEACL
jgi:hypothetical protein